MIYLPLMFYIKVSLSLIFYELSCEQISHLHLANPYAIALCLSTSVLNGNIALVPMHPLRGGTAEAVSLYKPDCGLPLRWELFIIC